MEPEGLLLPPVNSNPRQFSPFRISAYFHLALSTHRRTLSRHSSSAGRSLRSCTKNSSSISCFTHRTSRADAPWYVPHAVIKRGMLVLSAQQEVRNYSVVSPADKGLTITPKTWQNLYFKNTLQS